MVIFVMIEENVMNNIVPKLDSAFVTSKNAEFDRAYLNTLIHISPDSPAHIDWIYGIRNLAGMETAGDTFTIPQDELQVQFKDMLAASPDLFGNDVERKVYRSSKTERVYFVKNNVPELLTVLTEGTGHNRCVAVGKPESVKVFIDAFKERFSLPQSIEVSQVTGFGSNGSPDMKHTRMVKDETKIHLAKDEFYPFLKKMGTNIEQLAADFKNSKANVMLLIGPPGTGKTTFIRSMMFHISAPDSIVLAGDHVIGHPSFNSWLHSVEDGTLICAEDADILCAPREDENNIAMSNLLNFADGVISTGSKIIISTNLPTLKKVDPALLRKGRSFKVLEFGRLTADEANEARDSLGLTKINFGVDKISLAEAINFEEDNNADRPSFGFQ